MKIINDKKLPLKILSGFIAVVLWFAITYTEDPSISQHITNITTTFSGETQLHERGLTLVNTDELPALSVMIRGNRSKVISALDEVSALIDVSSIHDAGTHEVPVQYQYPQGSVTLTKSKITTVSVNVEKILSRDIPIKIETDSSDAGTDRLVAVKSSTESLTVRGAQSVVEKIAHAKVIVATSEITVDGNMDYDYKLYDKDDNILSENNIISKSQQTVSVAGTVYKKAELPVKVVLDEKIQDNYTLKVQKQSVDTLVIGLDDKSTLTELKVVLDSSILNERSPITTDIKIPEDVYCPEKDLTVNVEYELLPKTEHTVEVGVTPKNAPDGKEVAINPEKIKVSVKCAKDDAVASKISATIDASKLGKDEKTVDVAVSADAGIDVIGKYTVSAKLR